MTRLYRKVPITELQPSKAFKMKLNDIWAEAGMVEYEFKRRRAEVSRDTGRRSDASPLDDVVPLQPEAGS
jgi:hypothetical protein